MSILDVRHQPRAQRLIQRALSGGRIPHAYVFHGPNGVGKETFARGLAALLMCAKPASRRAPDLPEFAGGRGHVRDACGTCDQCRLVAAGTHPDLHLIYRQLKDFHPDSLVRDRVGRDIGVEVVREFVLGPVAARPTMATVKVFIIREADRITPQAQNALLKTLEEPPPGTFLILLAASLERLLPTTCSRCQVIPFAALPIPFVAERLLELRTDLTAEHADLFARLSAGSLGAALLMAEDSIQDYNDRLLTLLAKIAPGDALSASKALQDEAKSLGPRFHQRDGELTETESLRRGVKLLLQLAATWYRDVALASLSADDLIANRLHQGLVAAAARNRSAAAAAVGIRAIARAEEQLDQNVNVPLCLDALFARLSRL